MESLTLSSRKLAREDVWSGIGGSFLLHVLIFAVAIAGPLTTSKKITVNSAWTVDLVSMQDLGLGGEAASRAAAPKGAAVAKSQEGHKRESGGRDKSGPLVSVKRLQLNERSAKADAEIKKLETAEIPKFASSAKSSVAVEKSLDRLIPKPKPREERTASAPEARDANEKGAPAAATSSQKTTPVKAEGGQAGEKSAAGSRDGASKAGDKSAPAVGPPGGSDGAQVGLARRLYYTEIWNAIRRQWVLPEYLKAQHLETVLVVVIRRDGKVLDLRVEKSSGNEAYDESARRAVRKADPLPAFPAIYSPAQEEIGLRFRPEDLS